MSRGRSARASPRRAWATGLLALAALVLAALVLAACAPGSAAREGEITSATPLGDVFSPRFEVVADATHIERFDPPGAGAGFALAVGSTVRNPNAFGVVLQSVEYTLAIAGEAIASGAFEPELELSAGESGALAWTIAADLTERRALWSAVVGAYAGTPLPFEVEGRLVFASQSYVFTTGTRSLMSGTALAREAVRSPRLRLDGVRSRIALVRSDAPVAVITLVAVNPGDVGYFLSARDMVLELGGFVLATVDLGPVPMPAGETIRTEITFLIDRGRLGAGAEAALAAVLAGRDGAVRVKGSFVYDVLGVDSFVVDQLGDLVVTLPGRVAGADDGGDGTP